MQFHPFALAVALALAAGSVAAQTPQYGGKAPDSAGAAPAAQSSPDTAGTSGSRNTATTESTTMSSDMKTEKAAKPHNKTSAKSKSSTKHATSKKSKDSHAAKAKVSGAHHGTGSMGAGPATPMTDLNAAERQARMDQAYANWQKR